MTRRPVPFRADFQHPGCDTTPDELEFALAMYAFQKKHDRRFPAWSEVLYVLRTLGYSKGVAPLDAPPPPQPYGPDLSHTPTPEEIEACS
jgi:hypothetical protein